MVLHDVTLIASIPLPLCGTAAAGKLFVPFLHYDLQEQFYSKTPFTDPDGVLGLSSKQVLVHSPPIAVHRCPLLHDSAT